MKCWFTADHHFGHANIIDFCQRPFADVDAMDEALVARWNEVVGDEDEVWYLGDFAYRCGPNRAAYLFRPPPRQQEAPDHTGITTAATSLSCLGRPFPPTRRSESAKYPSSFFTMPCEFGTDATEALGTFTGTVTGRFPQKGDLAMSASTAGISTP